MAYCGPRGIPHSFFLGGPYEWTALDREKALAWMRREAKRCRCGTFKEEWEKDRDAYVGDIVHCEGCARLEQEGENISNMGGSKGMSARLVPPSMASEPIDPGLTDEERELEARLRSLPSLGTGPMVPAYPGGLG